MDGILIVVVMLGVLGGAVAYRFGYWAGYNDAMEYSMKQLDRLKGE